MGVSTLFPIVTSLLAASKKVPPPDYQNKCRRRLESPRICEVAHTTSRIVALSVSPLPRTAAWEHSAPLWRMPCREQVYGAEPCRGSSSTSARARRASGLSGLSDCLNQG